MTKAAAAAAEATTSIDGQIDRKTGLEEVKCCGIGKKSLGKTTTQTKQLV